MSKPVGPHHGDFEEEPAPAELWWYIAIIGMVAAVLITGLVVLTRAGIFRGV